MTRKTAKRPKVKAPLVQVRAFHPGGVAPWSPGGVTVGAPHRYAAMFRSAKDSAASYIAQWRARGKSVRVHRRDIRVEGLSIPTLVVVVREKAAS